MRQTIECEPCAGKPPRNQEHPVERVSRHTGFPLYDGLRCDFCSNPLSTSELVVAQGIWVEGRIPNIPGWHLDYIREPSDEEFKRYRQAETSAKEMRNDGGA